MALSHAPRLVPIIAVGDVDVQVEEDSKSIPSWQSSQILAFPWSPPNNEEATTQMPEEKPVKLSGMVVSLSPGPN
jgi:hypothetical protein